jgi:hypothetical protein
MKIHPITIILIGFLMCSVGFNILVIRKNYELEKQKKKPIIIILQEETEDTDILTIRASKGFDYN